MTRVALDAMGGDNAPVEMVKGAVDAVNKEQNVTDALSWYRRDCPGRAW